jgi:hypothetical protein
VDKLLLGDFLNDYKARKNEKNAFKNICRENGISYKKLPDLLKSFGYSYNMQIKEWIYEREGAQPLEIDIKEAIPARNRSTADVQQQSSVEIAAAEDIQQQKEYAQAIANTHEINAADVQQQNKQILNDQLFDIVLLLQQINKKLPDKSAAAQPVFDPALDDPEAAPLALQLHRINQSTKARKTINISEDAAGWLDSFSNTKGHKIGDLVSLAVSQLQKRIDPAYTKGEK